MSSCQNSVMPRHRWMDRLPGRIRRGFRLVSTIPVTTLVVVAVLAIAAFPDAAGLLQYNSQAGPWWTVLTGHLVHYNADHLFWDLVVFAGVGALLERRSRGLMLATLLGSGLLIPWLSVTGNPVVTTYAGLSGVDTALFAAFATLMGLDSLRQRRSAECCLYVGLLLAMLGKSLFELVTGSTLFVSSSAFVALPGAHVLGGGMGVLLAAFWCFAGLRASARAVGAGNRHR